MGKTNLLDAVYYLSMCKSRLNALDKYAVNHNERFFRLEARFSRLGKTEKIIAKYQKGKPKVFERNDIPYQRLTEHIGLIPSVIILPDDTAMIKEGSEERRRFLDNALCQIDPHYLSHLISYNRLLKQRNAYLKQTDGNPDSKLLGVYDAQMNGPAAFVLKRRKEFIKDFIPVFNNRYKEISKGAESMNLTYKSDLENASFIELAKSNFRKDCILQRTTAGIHKDDLIFELGEHSLKRFASQGQLKSFVLALGIARYDLLSKHGEVKPILLLDDIFDKLDTSRVNQLLALLSGDEFGQIFLTDTDKNRVKEAAVNFNREFRIYGVENGSIQTLNESD